LTATPRISVVIPTLGRVATLRRVLERLHTQTAPADDFEVIVVADAALSNLEELDGLVRTDGFRVRRLQASSPGASAARNVGWTAAAGSLLLFIDDDVLPDADLLRQHLVWHQRHPSIAIGVLGQVRWADELRVTPFMRWLEHGIQFNYPSITGEETVWGNFYTANVSVKRALVERAGGFDEQRLPFGYEDLDLALRMYRADGFRLLYNRSALAEHLHQMDIRFWQSRVKRIALSERQFVSIHPETPPYFYELFADAAGKRAVSGRIERVLRFIPRGVPLVGPYAWSRADLFYRQQLAGPFLEAWRDAERSGQR
jgi:GT2 family glycosyltransferase